MQSAWNRGALNPLVCKILVGSCGDRFAVDRLVSPALDSRGNSPARNRRAGGDAGSGLEEVREPSDPELAKIKPPRTLRLQIDWPGT